MKTALFLSNLLGPVCAGIWRRLQRWTKTSSICSLSTFAALVAATAPLKAANSWDFAFVNGRPVKFMWDTINGQNYDLYTSDDLLKWTHVEGFPQKGTGARLEHPFTPGLRGYFRIVPTVAPVSEFVYVPAGEYQMGDAKGDGFIDERPPHRVSLNAYYVSRFEVTKALWEEVRQWGLSKGYVDLPAGSQDANGWDYSPGPDHPVFYINWSEAVKWCNARSEREGLEPCYYNNAGWTSVHRTGTADLTSAMVKWHANGYRLPTEAEWERAARGKASGRVYPWGDTITHANANFIGHPDYNGQTAPVESFAANGLGLFNVTGNVAEWCWDNYKDDTYGSDYTAPPPLDPRGTAETGRRTFRGGSLKGDDWICRIAARSSYPIENEEDALGFRLVRSAADEQFVKIDNGQPSLPHPAAVPEFTVAMGRTSGDSMADAPQVTVSIQFYHIGKYEVTKRLWDRVRNWAATHGYSDLAAGSAKGLDHPVVSISWYDTIKWCNARSEMDELSPCYRVSGEVYRSGVRDDVTCDWNAGGHRLPSEAEWEAAARGGETGKRFPLGDTLTHALANYASNDRFPYDVSPTRGWHPTWRTGATPHTAPVGSFPPNGFGLYDMAGNAWERCWDWYKSDYYVSGAINPRGAPSGSMRVSRGGGWSYYADLCRSAARDANPPAEPFNGHGFRLARGLSAAP